MPLDAVSQSKVAFLAHSEQLFDDLDDATRIVYKTSKNDVVSVGKWCWFGCLQRWLIGGENIILDKRTLAGTLEGKINGLFDRSLAKDLFAAEQRGEVSEDGVTGVRAKTRTILQNLRKQAGEMNYIMPATQMLAMGHIDNWQPSAQPRPAASLGINIPPPQLHGHLEPSTGSPAASSGSSSAHGSPRSIGSSTDSPRSPAPREPEFSPWVYFMETLARKVPTTLTKQENDEFWRALRPQLIGLKGTDQNINKTIEIFQAQLAQTMADLAPAINERALNRLAREFAQNGLPRFVIDRIKQEAQAHINEQPDQFTTFVNALRQAETASMQQNKQGYTARLAEAYNELADRIGIPRLAQGFEFPKEWFYEQNLNEKFPELVIQLVLKNLEAHYQILPDPTACKALNIRVLQDNLRTASSHITLDADRRQLYDQIGQNINMFTYANTLPVLIGRYGLHRNDGLAPKAKLNSKALEKEVRGIIGKAGDLAEVEAGRIPIHTLFPLRYELTKSAGWFSSETTNHDLVPEQYLAAPQAVLYGQINIVDV